MEGFNLIGRENLAYQIAEIWQQFYILYIFVSKEAIEKHSCKEREREIAINVINTIKFGGLYPLPALRYPLYTVRYPLSAIRQSTIDTSENSLDSLSFADLLTPLLHDKSQQMLSLQRMCQEIMAGGLTDIGYANECP